MPVVKVHRNIHLVDLKVAGIENFIASYIVRGKRLAIVEAGPASTAQNLLAGLNEVSISLEDVAYIAVSHIHLDHCGASGALLKSLPNAKLIVHKRGAPHVANPDRLWAQAKQILASTAEIYGEPSPVPRDRIIIGVEGMTFNLGRGVHLNVVETLGHASHHLSYYETSSQGIFTGDAAGIYLSRIDTIVPTIPPPYRLDVASNALRKLMSLNPTSLYYTHFGKADNATKRLQLYLTQLELWAESAKRGLEKGEDLNSIRRRILRNDPALQEAAEYIRKHPILSKTVLNHSVKGIINYVENMNSSI